VASNAYFDISFKLYIYIKNLGFWRGELTSYWFYNNNNNIN
jgi:hypothetical protein